MKLVTWLREVGCGGRKEQDCTIKFSDWGDFVAPCDESAAKEAGNTMLLHRQDAITVSMEAKSCVPGKQYPGTEARSYLEQRQFQALKLGVLRYKAILCCYRRKPLLPSVLSPMDT